MSSQLNHCEQVNKEKKRKGFSATPESSVRAGFNGHAPPTIGKKPPPAPPSLPSTPTSPARFLALCQTFIVLTPRNTKRTSPSTLLNYSTPQARRTMGVRDLLKRKEGVITGEDVRALFK